MHNRLRIGRNIMVTEYKTYIDTDFTSGDSPVVIDLIADLGVQPKSVLIFIGKGLIDVELSYDGTTYGDIIPLRPDKKIVLNGLKAKKIRLTHSGVDSAYGVVSLPKGESVDIQSITELIAVTSVSTSSVTSNNATAVVLLSANTSRRGFIISSASNNDFWLRLQPSATNNTTKEGIFIDNAEVDPWHWPFEKHIYTGEISVIAATDSPVIHVIEF